MDGCAFACEVLDGTDARREDNDDGESEHGGHFRDGENVLHDAPKADAEIVHSGEEDDYGGCQGFDAEFVKGSDLSDEREMKGESLRGTDGLRDAGEAHGVLGENIAESG